MSVLRSYLPGAHCCAKLLGAFDFSPRLKRDSGGSRMRRTLPTLFLLMLVVVSNAFVWAQQAPSPAGDSTGGGELREPTVRKMKVGVALEGGGALGLAHIGVLQWL